MPKKIKLKRGEGYYLKILFQETKIKDIMTPDPVYIKASDRFSLVPEKFAKHNIRHLPVVDEKKRLIGLITQRDLFRIHPPRLSEEGEWFYDQGSMDNIIISHVMVREPCCMHANEAIGGALETFAQKKYGCIPIVDQDGVLCGILTQNDLLQVAAQIYQEGN